MRETETQKTNLKARGEPKKSKRYNCTREIQKVPRARKEYAIRLN